MSAVRCDCVADLPASAIDCNGEQRSNEHCKNGNSGFDNVFSGDLLYLRCCRPNSIEAEGRGDGEMHRPGPSRVPGSWRVADVFRGTRRYVQSLHGRKRSEAVVLCSPFDKTE